jgi:hypothetical protein
MRQTMHHNETSSVQFGLTSSSIPIIVITGAGVGGTKVRRVDASDADAVGADADETGIGGECSR